MVNDKIVLHCNSKLMAYINQFEVEIVVQCKISLLLKCFRHQMTLMMNPANHLQFCNLTFLYLIKAHSFVNFECAQIKVDPVV